jgi:hypothetical protein
VRCVHVRDIATATIIWQAKKKSAAALQQLFAAVIDLPAKSSRLANDRLDQTPMCVCSSTSHTPSNGTPSGPSVRVTQRVDGRRAVLSTLASSRTFKPPGKYFVNGSGSSSLIVHGPAQRDMNEI